MRSQNRTIWLLVLIAFVVLSAFMVVKWSQWSYTGLDLAIYTQALDQTLQGRFMNLTIHPHNYFGDHVELILVVLLPFYALIQHPLTLVLLQAAALCLGAWAVVALARRRWPTGRAPVWAAIAYLIHPFVINPAFYEFHALAFAIPLLLATLVAYDRQRWGWFLVGMTASLLVREDVGLAIAGIGLLAWVHHRPWKWRLVPIVVGLVWLFVALRIAGHLNGQGEYKFLEYYRWLGDSLPNMIQNALTRPWIVLQHLLGPVQIIGLLGILLPFAFLPLLALSTVVGLFPQLVQLLLLGVGDNSLRIHYTALLTPVLILATLNALKKIGDSQAPSRLAKLKQEKDIAILVLAVMVVAGSVVIGPASGLAQDWYNKRFDSRLNGQVAVAYNSELPKRLPVIASFRPIQRLAQTDHAYSLHYVHMGHRQYVKLPYPIADEAKTVIFDDRDLLLYQQIYPEKDFPEGFANIRKLLRERDLRLARQVGHLLTYATTGEVPPAPPMETTSQAITPVLKLVGASTAQQVQTKVGDRTFTGLALSLAFQISEKVDRNWQLRLTVSDEHGTVHRELYALNPLFPTHDWEPNTTVQWNYWPVIQRALGDGATVTAEVVNITGQGGLDGLRGISIQHQKVTPLGEPITLRVSR